MKRKHLLFLVALFATITVSAYDFEVDSICYNRNGSNVTVTYRDSNYNSYSGIITIPETVTYNGATYSVTSIGDNAFSDCSGLTSVTIPESVTSIGYSAFSGCSGLTQVHISDISKWCEISFADYYYSNPLEYAHNLYLNNELVTDLVIPDHITTIKDYAFRGCSSLKSVVIPNSVTSFGRDSFIFCSGLTEVIIPNSVTLIGRAAFYGCSGLTSMTIPESVTTISFDAFNGCTGLTSVTIPNSVTSLGEDAFYGCTGLTEVKVYNPQPIYISYGVFYNVPMSTCTLYVPTGSRELYAAANEWKNFANIVEMIPFDSFSFEYESYETYVGDILSLNAVIVPSGSVVVNPVWTSSDDSIATVDSKGDVTAHSVGTVTITVTSGELSASCHVVCFSALPDATGNYFTVWTDENIPIRYHVTSDNTVEVDAHDIPTTYRGVVNIPATVKAKYVPASGVAEVREYTVTAIRANAFNGCSDMTAVTIPNTVTSIGASAFSRCSGLTSVTIPESVNAIYYCAFYGCSGLTEVNIPAAVTTISDSTFSGCSGLTEVTIPETITSIGGYAFSNCTGLTKVEIPETVTKIGYGAFSGCTGLSEIYVYATDPATMAMMGNVFGDVPTSTCTLYVPTGSRELYAAANEWKNFANIVEMIPCDSFSFEYESYETYVGNILSLNAVTVPSGSVVVNPVWTSSDTGIATVDSRGNVTAHSVGTVTITVTSGELSASCQVVCLPALPVVADGYFIAQNVDGVDIRYHITSDNAVEVVALENDEEYTGVVNIPASVRAKLAPDPVINWNGTWNSASQSNAYDGLQYTCNSPGTNGSTTTRCTFSNVRSITFTVVSNGESNYDYLTVGNLDSSCSRTVYKDKYSTKGSVQTVTYTISDTNEHYVEFCYSKDGSVDSSPDNATVYVSAVECVGGICEYNVTSIGDSAFDGAIGLEKLTLPATVTNVGQEAFAGCTAIMSIVSQALVPPTVSDTAFGDIDKAACVLYVPRSTIDDYRTADGWKDFANIRPIGLGDTDGDGEVTITDVVNVVNYILGNPSEEFVFENADTDSDDQITVTDVVTIVNIILRTESANASS